MPIDFAQMGESSKSQKGTPEVRPTTVFGSRSWAEEIETEKLAEKQKSAIEIGLEKKDKRRGVELLVHQKV